MKLGKRARRIDPRTLQMASYAKAELPQPPPYVTWNAAVGAYWGMMLNDALGDCTCAAVGHTIMAMTAQHGDVVTPSDADVLAAYQACGGYVPDNPSTDNGAVELDVLNYWRKTGMAGHRLGAYAAVRPADPAEVRTAIWLFGSIYAGIALPVSAEGQEVWSVDLDDPRYLQSHGAPGSWGGHAVPLLGYNRVGPICVTWGSPLQITWDFWTTYADEAYAPLSPDWVDGTLEAPSGFDLAQLTKDLEAL